MLGILLIDKPAGCTSHDVVNDIRRRFGTKRVGHAGTLDPMATGLLVVAVGPATRFLQYLPLEPKEYLAEITFGQTTDSYDAEGQVTAEAEVPDDLHGAIAAAQPNFMGLIEQIPPMYSAIKVAGKPLYKHARQGLEVEREPRRVHISTFDVSITGPNTANAKIVCSGGTYVRSLAHDLGVGIGCGAHLSKLQRTKVGRFELTEACSLSDAKPELLMPLAEALPPMPVIDVTPQQVVQIREGRQIGWPELIDSHLVALVEPGRGVFSIARVHGNLLQPECVIPNEAIVDSV